MKFRQLKPLVTQFLCFAGVRAIGTLAHYGVLIMLVQGAGVGAVPASTAGFVVGALINYILNYRYTFASTRRHHETLLRFFIVAGVGLLLNGLLMTLGTKWLDLNYLLTQVLSTGFVLLWNFTINRIWTFRQP